MNSTGKDLSSADLIRNFVLMGLSKEKQDALYLNHWRKIELILGADIYEDTFDEFLRNYLTVLYAPEPLVKRDIYHIFKRHVADRGYDKDNRIVDLLKELEKFADYYARITRGMESEPSRRRVLAELRKLNVTVINPLLLSLYDDYYQGAFADEDFLHMLELTESYVFRRSICDAQTNSLNKFLPSVIAKLNKVQDEGGNYAEAFESFLLLESGTPRRFPDNAEFFNALTTRDAYHYRHSLYLLSNLENLHHPKDPLDLENGSFTIEHVMPQNALASPGWKSALVDTDEEAFNALVNNLGNLTLSAYNSELSDDSFEEKKKRYVGGYGKDYLVISNAMRRAESWGDEQIKSRAIGLARDAEARWRYLGIDSATAKKYDSQKAKNIAGRSAIFRNVFEKGLICPNTILVPKNDRYPITARVTASGMIELANGEQFKSPSLAAVRATSLVTGESRSRNGWHFWKVGENGPLLDELRSEYLLRNGKSVTSDVRRFRIAFWDGFYDYCSNNEAFTSCFNDPSDRPDNSDTWASFGIGMPNMHVAAMLSTSPKFHGVQLWCDTLKTYAELLPLKEEFNQLWRNGTYIDLEWDAYDENKKSRHVVVKMTADYDSDNWEDIYQWLVEGLFRMRDLALAATAN